MNNVSSSTQWPAWIQQCIEYDREEIHNAVNTPKEPEWPNVDFGD